METSILVALGSLDLMRLAGVNLILGVDVTERRARIVALKRAASLTHGRRYRFRAVHHDTVEFPPGISPTEQGRMIREALAAPGVRAPFAVSAVRSPGVKCVTAFVPEDVDNIEEWLEDHSDKLLRIPVPQGGVMFRYEFLDRARRRIEIAFVRKDDIWAWRKLFEESGLNLIALGAGVRDAVNPFLMEEVGDATFLYEDEDAITEMELEDGHRGPMGERMGEERRVPESARNVVRAGPGTGEGGFRPLGLPSEYSLAAGLALKGFLPGLSPMNFLEREQTASFALTVHRMLAKRVALICGMALAILLGLPAVGGFLLQSRLETLEAQARMGATAFREVAELERKVRSLEARLPGGMNRSIVGRLLYEVASSAPDSVWFSRLTVNTAPAGVLAITIAGYTRSQAHVAQFLRALQTATSSQEVSLIRSAAEAPKEMALPVTERTGVVAFEIRSSFPERYP